MLRASASPAGGQDQAAILFVFQQALGIEPLHHVGHAGLGDFERSSDVHHPGVALGIDQLEDALEVILDRGGAGQRRSEIFCGPWRTIEECGRS